MDAIYELVDNQLWENLQIVERIRLNDNGVEGRGVLATVDLRQNDLICDYHGIRIPQALAKSYMEETNDAIRKSDYLMTLPFLNGIHIDSHAERCPCHPHLRTLGRLFNHAKRKDAACNVKLQFYNFVHIPEAYGCLLIASKPIPALTELRYDYGGRACEEMFA
jgi:hypothetical protein